MRDTLNPGELAFQYGSTLQQNSVTSVSAQIITEKDGDNYTSVKFQVTFEIDPAQVIPYNRPNVPPRAGKNYQVNYNEIGFAENKELSASAVSQLFVSFQGARPVLNVAVPLAGGVKRDSESFTLAKRPSRAKNKTNKI